MVSERPGVAMGIVSRRQFLLVIGVVVVVLLAVSFGRLVLVGYELNQQAQALRDEIAALETQNKSLREGLAYWQTDEGLERLARERLGWAKPGETLVVTVPTGNQAVKAAPAPRSPEGPPNWLRWWRLFAG